MPVAKQVDWTFPAAHCKCQWYTYVQSEQLWWWWGGLCKAIGLAGAGIPPHHFASCLSEILPTHSTVYCLERTPVSVSEHPASLLTMWLHRQKKKRRSTRHEPETAAFSAPRSALLSLPLRATNDPFLVLGATRTVVRPSLAHHTSPRSPARHG
jgi:hypothetical protein